MELGLFFSFLFFFVSTRKYVIYSEKKKTDLELLFKKNIGRDRSGYAVGGLYPNQASLPPCVVLPFKKSSCSEASWAYPLYRLHILWPPED